MQSRPIRQKPCSWCAYRAPNMTRQLEAVLIKSYYPCLYQVFPNPPTALLPLEDDMVWGLVARERLLMVNTSQSGTVTNQCTSTTANRARNKRARPFGERLAFALAISHSLVVAALQAIAFLTSRTVRFDSQTVGHHQIAHKGWCTLAGAKSINSKKVMKTGGTAVVDKHHHMMTWAKQDRCLCC